ncbi:MAG: SpoIIE family protein phosphatase [Acidobacteria bacterium]|nr:SpoIIE family protein phosphatase [Acidobacteriota bacterium]
MDINRQGGANGRVRRMFAVARGWLRRVMPRVALASVALCVLWLFVNKTAVYRGTPLRLLGPLTFCAVAATIAYYGLKSLVRLKNVLLWRVRRRLMITYLFVGLTPIVLLLVLGFFAAMGASQQALVRVVTVQLNTTERQTRESARTLADALSELPPGTGDRNIQAWLDERTALLQTSLPGARVAVWRGAGAATPVDNEPAQFVGGPPQADENTRGVGEDAGAAGEPLPVWLRGQEDWSGLAFMPPPETSRSAFGSPSVRALARGRASGRAIALLVTVPVSRALIKQYRENTGINVRPFFIAARGNELLNGEGDVNVSVDESDAGAGGGDEGRVVLVRDRGGRQTRMDFRRDQFGDPIPKSSLAAFSYPVFLPSTDWRGGTQTSGWAFMVDWSWAQSGRQFWGDTKLGQGWRQALIFLGGFFLALEVLALLSAAWMTRAVTGTVHKLYRATESVKRGDFSHRIRTRSRDQLGELASAFNEMSSNIETLLEERVEREWLEREVEIAAEVQGQLFPRSVPRLASVEMSGECRAARGVAGDYYDYVEVAPGLVAFALGDVSGKGISAALVMSNLQATLRAQVTIIAERMKLAAQSKAASAQAGGVQVAFASSTPGGGEAEMPCGVTGADTQCAVSNMAASINGQLCHSTDDNRFATLFLALYDERTRLLRYTNAGHNAAILVRAGGSIERLSTGGMMVGAFDWAEYEEAQVPFADGDLLVVFSDGLTEAQNTTGEEYGEKRLAQFAAARRGQSSQELRRAIFDEVNNWSGAAERADDQTLVIVKALVEDGR